MAYTWTIDDVYLRQEQSSSSSRSSSSSSSRSSSSSSSSKSSSSSSSSRSSSSSSSSSSRSSSSSSKSSSSSSSRSSSSSSSSSSMSSSSSSSSLSSSSSSSSFSSSSMAIGTWSWGHDTDVTQDYTGDLADGSGTAGVIGAGDDEKVVIDPGEETIMHSVNTGAIEIIITYDQYQSGSGSAGTLWKRTGNSRVNCEAAGWSEYTGHFTSEGWIQTKFTK